MFVLQLSWVRAVTLLLIGFLSGKVIGVGWLGTKSASSTRPGWKMLANVSGIYIYSLCPFFLSVVVFHGPNFAARYSVRKNHAFVENQPHDARCLVIGAFHLHEQPVHAHVIGV